MAEFPLSVAHTVEQQSALFRHTSPRTTHAGADGEQLVGSHAHREFASALHDVLSV
jgi:hypothetical protein